MESKEILYSLLKGCDFNNLCASNWVSHIYDEIKLDYPNSICFSSGATKGVLIPVEEDYVLKIPFFCEYESYSEQYLEFYGADEPEGKDYCMVEIIKYEQVKEAGLEDCFAKIEILGRVNDRPIYIQEKATEIFSDDREAAFYSEAIKESTKAKCQELNVDCFNACWISDFLNYFSEEVFIKLQDFLYNNRIWDLHSGNLGYIGDRPVIIDWGGYNE